jgi:hypothetical protein
VDIKLKCECGQVLKVGEEAAGKVGTCPACNNRIRIPSLEEIEKVRQQQTPASVESEEMEEAEEEMEEEAPKKPTTRSFKAPARSKTRSKALADVRGDKEERKKKSSGRARRAEKGKTTRRGKSRTKTRARRTTSVMDKYRAKPGGEEEEEGGYVRKKKNPLKILIVIGIVVVGGLIAAYALKWGPDSNSKRIHREYVNQMEQFVRDVRDSMIEKYEKMIPASTSDYDRRLEEIKRVAGQVQAVVRQHSGMARVYRQRDRDGQPTSLMLMHETIKNLEEARKIIQDRVDAELQASLSAEKQQEFKRNFTSTIAEANTKVATIMKRLDSLRPQIGMTNRYYE